MYQKLLPTLHDETPRIPALEILLGTPIVTKYILEGREGELLDVIIKSHEEGMIDLNSALLHLVESEWVSLKTALEANSKTRRPQDETKGYCLMNTLILSDATPAFLLSPWKPILIFAIFIAWGWLVSTHLEKDARDAHLNPAKWNGIHIAAASVALAIMLFGINFYAAYPIGIIVLLTPIFAYWKVRNEAVAPEHKYKLSSGSFQASKEKRKIAKANKQVTMTFNGANGTIKVPDKENPKIEIYIAVEELIAKAIQNRASRIDIRLTKNGCQSMYLVDGMPIKQEPLSADIGAKVFTFIKEIAGTDPEDVRRLQTGTFELSGPLGSSQVDLTASGSSNTHVFTTRVRSSRQGAAHLGIYWATSEAARFTRPTQEPRIATRGGSLWRRESERTHNNFVRCS